MKLRKTHALIVSSLIILTCQAVFAQQVTQSGSQDFKARMEAVFEKLDKSKIKTGILHDKVMSFSKPEDYTGLTNRTVTLRNWRQIYFEMVNSSLETPDFPPLKELNERAKSSLRNSLVPIAIMNLQYNKIKPNAVASGLLRIENGQYVDVANPVESPYEGRRVFAASALQGYSYLTELIFLLDDAFFMTNEPEKLQYIEIDFDDGRGYQRVQLGNRVSISYPFPGQKQIKVRAVYESQILESAFFFDIRVLNGAAQPDITWANEVSSYPYLGQNAVYDAFIFLGNGNSVVTKPILFAEGFDLDNSRGWPEIWALLNQQNLAPTLQAAGYDIVIMNFADATDYIQRNSLALVTLIEKLNDEKSGTEPLVVTGASMGGLAARYGLTWMETNSIPHETRLYMSFDTPHQSANIPLGEQYFAFFFAEYEASVADLLDALNSSAAQQMLAYHHLDAPSIGQNPLRVQLFTELSGMGNYPSTPGLRNVAIANGSGAGAAGGQISNSSVLMQPGDELLDWDYRSLLLDIESQVWALPDISPQTQIFHGLVDLIFPLPDDELNVFVTGTLPYDSPQGGTSDTQQQIVNTVLAAGMGPISTNFPNHCFIPTISALDLRDIGGDPLGLSYNLNNDPNLLTKAPFDTLFYPAGTLNEEHVGITAANAAFLLEQVNLGQPLPPAAPDNLIATSSGATTIDLNWGDNSGDEDGFTIERHDGGGIFSEIAIVGPNTTAFSDSNLIENTTYTYRVFAFNINGVSAYSNEASTIPIDPTINLALNQPVAASNEHENFPVINAVDGLTGTFWGSRVFGDEWVSIDLQNPTPLGRVIVKWNGGFFASGYQFQVSDDNQNWTTVYSTTSGAGGNESFEFPQTMAQYARLYQTAFNGTVISITELEVYSGPLPLAGGEFRVNAGGGNYTTLGGSLFVADQPYTPGSFGYTGGITVNLAEPIAGTNDDPLYNAIRGANSTFDYTFDGLAPGNYQVDLYFMEPQFSSNGQRQLDVLMEDNVIYDNLDIFVESGGRYTALIKTNTINVTDGQLKVEFVPVIRAAILCAIAVTEQSSSTELAAQFTLQKENSDVVPTTLQLHQNYPNPFNPSTKISFELNEAGRTSLQVFNVIGQLVRTLTDRPYQPGFHTVDWDARDDAGRRVPSGLYVYRLEFGRRTIVRKMILMR